MYVVVSRFWTDRRRESPILERSKMLLTFTNRYIDNRQPSTCEDGWILLIKIRNVIPFRHRVSIEPPLKVGRGTSPQLLLIPWCAYGRNLDEGS